MEYIEDIKDSFDSVDPTQAPSEPPKLDPERYSAFVKNPSDISEDVLYQLSDIITGHMNLRMKKNETGLVTTPNVVDRLMNAVTIVYIEEEGVPVGVASLTDPTQKNYMGFKPVELYSLQSGVNLEGRVLLDLFAIPDEYADKGIAEEILAQIDALDVKVFAVTDLDDETTPMLLERFEFQPMANIEIDSNEVPVTLWLRK